MSWDAFAALADKEKGAKYQLQNAQLHAAPPGMEGKLNRYIGDSTINCSMFTAYLLGHGLGGPFTSDTWGEWQLAKGATESKYRGYGPKVVTEWGKGTLIHAGRKPSGGFPKPANGVYLIQSFTTWPRGHSWLAIDYDEATDKVLTLEANSGYNLNGIGFAGVGNWRDVHSLADWPAHGAPTWASRTRSYTEAYIAKLDIDIATVRNWEKTFTR
jgi:hypothetical protein